MTIYFFYVVLNSNLNSLINEKIIYTLLFFLLGFVPVYSQVLENKDRILFERSGGDTVYVLEEHVNYNLGTDQNGCVRKDSSVCRNLAGVLVIPKDFEKQVLDSCISLYGYDSGREIFTKTLKHYSSDYLYFWQNKNSKEKIIYSDVFLEAKSYKEFFATKTFKRSLGFFVDEQGRVSFVTHEWLEEVKVLLGWISIFTSLLLSVLFFRIVSRRDVIFPIEPNLDSKYLVKNIISIGWDMLQCAFKSILGGIVIVTVFSFLNGLFAGIFWIDFSFMKLFVCFLLFLFVGTLFIYIPRAYASRQEYLEERTELSRE